MRALFAIFALSALLFMSGCMSRNVETDDETTPSGGLVPGQISQ